MFQTVFYCHCGLVDPVQAPTLEEIVGLLADRGWRFMHTVDGRFVVWGCSDRCANRLKPAITCRVRALALEAQEVER